MTKTKLHIIAFFVMLILFIIMGTPAAKACGYSEVDTLQFSDDFLKGG